MSLGEFYKKLIRQDEIKEIVEEIRLAEVIAVAVSSSTSKEGNRQYNKWQREKSNELRDKQQEETMTVFEKLRKSKVSNTVFSRLKFLKGKKRGL